MTELILQYIRTYIHTYITYIYLLCMCVCVPWFEGMYDYDSFSCNEQNIEINSLVHG